MRFLLLLSFALAQAGAAQFTTSLPPVPAPSEVTPTPSLVPAPPRMETDDAPTAHACTFARAIRGDHCTFEGLAGVGDVRSNSSIASRAGEEACAAEAQDDDSLRGSCAREVDQISA